MTNTKSHSIIVDTSDAMTGVDCVADWAETATEEQRLELQRDWEQLCADKRAVNCAVEGGKYVCNMSPEFMDMLKKHGVTHD